MFVTEQADFSAGMWRGRRAPENAVFDLVNGLYNDEGEPFKRGGSVYKSNADANTAILGLWDGETVAGHRTLFWTATRVYTLDSNDATPVAVTTAFAPDAFARAEEIGGLVFLQGPVVTGSKTEIVWAGSRKTASYSTGTITVSAGSTAVTGAGTAWLANVDPGMLIFDAGGTRAFGVVKSVESNTALTLHRPAPVAKAASTYEMRPIERADPYTVAAGPGVVNPTSAFHAVAGYRLLRIVDNRVYESLALDEGDFYGTGGAGSFFGYQPALGSTYVEVPQGQAMKGAMGVGEDVLLFTGSGIWTLSNLAFDPVDDVGNIQQTLQLTSPEIVLWGNPGLARWRGAIVVPALDDIYLLGQGPISEGIRPLYRSYVAAGYTPGQASVHRSHYELPILNGSTLVDTLVCRLDRGFAWSRKSGAACGVALAQRVVSGEEPSLLAASGLRVLDLTGCFAPSDANRTDADGAAPAFSLTTRDFDTGPGIKGGLLRHARLEYDLIAPSALATLSVASATGAEGSAFTAHADQAPEADGGSKTWMLNRFGERVRLRFECSNAAAELRLRRLELHCQESLRP